MGERGVEAHAISAVTGQGVQVLMRALLSCSNRCRPLSLSARWSRSFVRRGRERVQDRARGGWLAGARRARRARGGHDPLCVPEAAARFQRQLAAMGVMTALEKAGVQPGDLVRIGERELEWQA